MVKIYKDRGARDFLGNLGLVRKRDRVGGGHVALVWFWGGGEHQSRRVSVLPFYYLRSRTLHVRNETVRRGSIDRRACVTYPRIGELGPIRAFFERCAALRALRTLLSLCLELCRRDRAAKACYRHRAVAGRQAARAAIRVGDGSRPSSAPSLMNPRRTPYTRHFQSEWVPRWRSNRFEVAPDSPAAWPVRRRRGRSLDCRPGSAPFR